MNRFKFRVWDSRCDEFLYHEAPIYYEEDNGFHAGAEHSNGDWCDMPIMQWTGLHDANGREIYEDDILEESLGYYFRVVWDDEWAKFKLQHGSKAIQYPEWNRGKKMKVVGNIFETPLLLNKAA